MCYVMCYVAIHTNAELDRESIHTENIRWAACTMENESDVRHSPAVKVVRSDKEPVFRRDGADSVAS